MKMATIHIIMSIAVSKNWYLRQLDVQNMFLHGVLEEDVFMKQPPGYIESNHPLHVCKLNKALYGLKQSSRVWYNRLIVKLLQLGFSMSKVDTSLFRFNKNMVLSCITWSM
jgi:hypothetical protein